MVYCHSLMTEQLISKPMITENNWQTSAACLGNSKPFFGPDTEDRRSSESPKEKIKREAEAKKICKECPVIVFCREYALSKKERYGVWGGLGEKERDVLFKKRRIR
jgi:WhiB family redox-sensing transcriptional regulator